MQDVLLLRKNIAALLEMEQVNNEIRQYGVTNSRRMRYTAACESHYIPVVSYQELRQQTLQLSLEFLVGWIGKLKSLSTVYSTNKLQIDEKIAKIKELARKLPDKAADFTIPYQSCLEVGMHSVLTDLKQIANLFAHTGYLHQLLIKDMLRNKSLIKPLINSLRNMDDKTAEKHLIHMADDYAGITKKLLSDFNMSRTRNDEGLEEYLSKYQHFGGDPIQLIVPNKNSFTFNNSHLKHQLNQSGFTHAPHLNPANTNNHNPGNKKEVIITNVTMKTILDIIENVEEFYASENKIDNMILNESENNEDENRHFLDKKYEGETFSSYFKGVFSNIDLDTKSGHNAFILVLASTVYALIKYETIEYCQSRASSDVKHMLDLSTTLASHYSLLYNGWDLGVDILDYGATAVDVGVSTLLGGPVGGITALGKHAALYTARNYIASRQS